MLCTPRSFFYTNPVAKVFEIDSFCVTPTASDNQVFFTITSYKLNIFSDYTLFQCSNLARNNKDIVWKGSKICMKEISWMNTMLGFSFPSFCFVLVWIFNIFTLKHLPCLIFENYTKQYDFFCLLLSYYFCCVFD